jgi:Xaa-Pro aminopeptidase
MSDEYEKIPHSEIKYRIERLRNHLKGDNFDGALILTTTDLYYYSGYGGDGAIYVPTDGKPIHLVKRNLPLAKQYSGLSSVKSYGRQSKLIQNLEIESGTTIAIDADILPFSFVTFLQKQAEGIQFIDGSHLLRKIRAVKSSFEIDLIEQAATVVDESFEMCKEIAKPDMTEIELASQLDAWMLKNGHSGFITTRSLNSIMPSYSFVISSNSATLNTFFTPVSAGGLSLKYPYGPSNRKIGNNTPFLVDTCGNRQGYISDTTRTFVCGRFDSETQSQLDALAQVKQFLRRNLKPSNNLGQLYAEILELVKELRIHEYFMGTSSDHVPFLGHGVGLELDELPIFYSKGPNLEVGNVIACEPKIIKPKQIVLGIEDTYAITESGNQLLSKASDFFEI